MQSGILNEIIQVEKMVTEPSQYSDAAVISYAVRIPRTRASVKYQSGNRTNDNNEIFFAHNVIFTVRIYHPIENTDRIIWRGGKYRILSIEIDRALQRKIITTELINE